MNSAERKSGGYSRSRKRLVYWVGGGTWVSGTLWLVFHYFLVRQGEFGPERHPLEPWWLKLHGAFAFGAIGMFGWMWGTHITKVWPSSRRRWSGVAVTGIFGLLIVSGYLLYYVGEEGIRSVTSILHWGIGLGAPLFLVWHWIGSRIRAKGSSFE